MQSQSLLFADDEIECQGTISTRGEGGRGALPIWAGPGCTGTRATRARVVSMGSQQEPVVDTTGRAQIGALSIL